MKRNKTTKRVYTKRASRWFKNGQKNDDTLSKYLVQSSTIVTRGPISFATLSDGRIAIKFDLT